MCRRVGGAELATTALWNLLLVISLIPTTTRAPRRFWAIRLSWSLRNMMLSLSRNFCLHPSGKQTIHLFSYPSALAKEVALHTLGVACWSSMEIKPSLTHRGATSCAVCAKALPPRILASLRNFHFHICMTCHN